MNSHYWAGCSALYWASDRGVRIFKNFNTNLTILKLDLRITCLSLCIIYNQNTGSLFWLGRAKWQERSKWRGTVKIWQDWFCPSAELWACSIGNAKETISVVVANRALLINQTLENSMQKCLTIPAYNEKLLLQTIWAATVLPSFWHAHQFVTHVTSPEIMESARVRSAVKDWLGVAAHVVHGGTFSCWFFFLQFIDPFSLKSSYYCN